MFLIILAAILNLFIDIYYLFYSAWLITSLKIKIARKYIKPLFEESVLSGICLTSDLDLFLHMNNARYIRHCDYARFKVLMETGVWDSILACGGTAVVGGHCIRYRKPIDFLTRYEIQAKIIYWDDNSFYVEQTFTDKKDGFVYCVNITKQTLVRVTTDQVLKKMGSQEKRPTPLPELSKWIESVELSSLRLRKDQ